ncbi:MAG: PEP-CTERM sorting domain-containing protein [Kiritimatiellae bacterium]|nr:PEP-CTERM sorting domain-containing protein [Kiritimatiellia bacterium]
MKKLMTVAAAVMLGMVANAASVSWDNADGDLYGYATGAVANDYAVYFFNTAALTLADANSYLASGDVATLIGKGQAGAVADGGWVEGEATGYTAGTSITAYLIAFNSDDATTATFAYVSDTADISLPGSGVTANYSFDLSSSATAGNWTAVPEPTSGLLMLLGMAGLALKRKRA